LAKKYRGKITATCVFHAEDDDTDFVIRLRGPGALTLQAKKDVEAWTTLEEQVHEHVWGAWNENWNENKQWRCRKLERDFGNKIHVYCVGREEDDDDTDYVIKLCGPEESVRQAVQEVKAWTTMPPIFVRHGWHVQFTGDMSQFLFNLKETQRVHAFMENKREGCNHFFIAGKKEDAINAFADVLTLKHVDLEHHHEEWWFSENDSCVRDDQDWLGNDHFSRDPEHNNICKLASERLGEDGMWRIVMEDTA